MIKGLINKILTHSAVDGPGNRMVFFLQGCNFKCHYCHNPETIGPSNEAYLLTVEQAIKRVKAVAPFISGITVSGGEATLQPEFVRELFSEARKLGLTTFLDTNASCLTNLEEIAPVLDKAMVDVKAIDIDEHRKLTGKSNEEVLQSLTYLAKQDKLYEIRTVVVPDILDNQKTVEYVSRFIAKHSPTTRYKLIRFRNHGVRKPYDKYAPPSDELMEQLKTLASARGCQVVVV